jgi:hypothetical protein
MGKVLWSQMPTLPYPQTHTCTTSTPTPTLVPVGMPQALWWQAARGRKSRRRVRVPTTTPRSNCSGSLLTHHYPPQQKIHSQKASFFMFNWAEAALLLLSSRCPCLLFQQTPSSPLFAKCILQTATWLIFSSHCQEKWHILTKPKYLSNHWACCLLGTQRCMRQLPALEEWCPIKAEGPRRGLWRERLCEQSN